MAWYDDILGTGSNIFGAKPADYLVGKEGLLNETEQQKLSQRALTSGLLGTAITYLAQPKNQRYGSALPYLGKAFLTGMGQSQGVYDQATQDWLTKQKVSDIQKATAKEKQLKDVLSTMGKTFDINTFDNLVKTGNLDAAKQYADIFETTKKITAEPKAGYKVLTKDEVKALNKNGYNLNPAATWQFNATTGQYDPITGTMPSKETPKDTFKILSPTDIKSIEEKQGIKIDTTRGQVYQQNTVTQQISPVGNQMESPVKPTQTIDDKDKATVNVVLEKLGVPKPSNITTTAIASRANQIMTQTGDDQFTAIQKATAEFQKSKAITTSKNWLGSKSTDLTIKKPLDSF
jgi:hypothetical protein